VAEEVDHPFLLEVVGVAVLLDRAVRVLIYSEVRHL